MARTFRDERDYRDVQENARGSWGLTLAGLLLMGVGIFVCATGDLAHILVLMLVVVLLLGGVALLENERRMLQEIDALLRTSPIAIQKPTPVEEADTVIDIFDNTLFDMVPDVYRRFDDWELGDKAGTVAPICPAFFRPGSWIGTDRDGNPNVTAKVSRLSLIHI